MQNERPDDATGDSVNDTILLMARVEAFIKALLLFLGYRVAELDLAQALNAAISWLEGAQKIRRDSQGATAHIWWDVFKAALLESRGKKEYAAQIADEAVDEFGRRFLPVAEDERDTLNTADFDAMRAELDQADRYRGEISDALDGNTGERQWLHARLIDELRAERDALLAANKHHASEIEQLRSKVASYESEIDFRGKAFDDFVNKLRTTLGITRLDADPIAIASDVRTERDALKAQVSYLEKLRTIGGDGHETERSFWASVVSGWEQCTGCATPSEARDTMSALHKERDALKAQLAGAIVPLPKPERVEPGQSWAYIDRVSRRIDDGSVRLLSGDFGVAHIMLDHANWIYLGKDA